MILEKRKRRKSLSVKKVENGNVFCFDARTDTVTMNKKESEYRMLKGSEMTRHRCIHRYACACMYMCVCKNITEWFPWGGGGCGDEGELASF